MLFVNPCHAMIFAFTCKALKALSMDEDLPQVTVACKAARRLNTVQLQWSGDWAEACQVGLALDALAGSMRSNQVAEADHKACFATQTIHAQDETVHGRNCVC